MSKNGSITSFFKPVVNSSRSPQHNTTITAPNTNEPSLPSSTPPPPSPSPLPGLFSSSPPAPPASTVRNRNAVIRGSDDEDSNDYDSDSDDDFPSLFPSTKPPVNTTTTSHTTTTTTTTTTSHRDNAHPTRDTTTRTPNPKRRRAALDTDTDFLSSPLTINTRRQEKHKFDMAAFLKHAEADLALEESELRTAALLARGSPGSSSSRRVRTGPEAGGVRDGGGGGGGGDGGGLYDAMLEVLSDADDSQGEGHKGRLLRAVKRTEAAVQRREWFFFDRLGQVNEGAAIKARPSFPKAKATGLWALLAVPEKQRAEVFEDGLPYHVQCKMGNLPDEIFLWVLREVSHERSARLRDEYLRLLGVCSDQVARLVDENVVADLFRELGASDRALAEGASQPAGACEKGAPYPEQHRGRLRATLRGLAEMAHAMRLPALTRAMSILLRLGIDNMMREDYVVTADYQDAMYHIVAAVPWRSWDNFCGTTSQLLYSHAQEATLRWNAVSAIPLLHAKLIELRRRLALVFVFDDPQRAFSRPQGTFSVRSVIDRLDQADEFVVDRNNTDYFELLALSEMLSVAVGDGSPPAGDEASPEAVKQYNDDVDELSQRVKFMWSNIHEQGAAYMSRLEARVQLKDFERKLQHVVRTRPPPKDNIFGIDAKDDDEVERPKQQQFMKRFLSKSQPPPKTP